MSDEPGLDVVAMVALIRSDDRVEQGRGVTILRGFLARHVRRFARRVSESDVEDIVQTSTLRMWRALRNHAEPINHVGYFLRALSNEVNSFFRRQRTLPVPQDEIEAIEAPVNAAAGAADTAQDLRDRYDALVEAAASARQPAYAAELRETCAELWDLVTGARTLDQVLAPAPGEPRNKARNRHQKRHQRAREALDEALGRLVAAGTIPKDSEPFYRELLGRMRLRQKARGGRV